MRIKINTNDPIHNEHTSLTPGTHHGLNPIKNYNALAPMAKSNHTSDMGIPAPAKVAAALGVKIGMPVHQGAVGPLVNHPDTDVAAEAKRLMKKY